MEKSEIEKILFEYLKKNLMVSLSKYKEMGACQRVECSLYLDGIVITTDYIYMDID